MITSVSSSPFLSGGSAIGPLDTSTSTFSQTLGLSLTGPLKTSVSSSPQIYGVSASGHDSEQPTGTFQFGQLDACAPLGGATTWAKSGDPWYQTTPPFLDSETPQPQNTLQTSEMFSQPFTLQGAFSSNSRPEVDFSSSELLRLLAAAKQQQDFANQESQAGGFNFTPYVVNEPGEETSLQEVTKPISTVIVEECDDYEEFIEESEDSTDESLSYTSAEGEDDGEENEDSLESSSPMPPMKSSQTQPPFSPSQGKLLTTPLNAEPANLPTHLTGRRFMTLQSALKSTKKQDEDCLVVYEVRASMANREKASRLWLPSNFFNYVKQEVCPGCLGCGGITKETTTLTKKEDKTNTIVPHSEENAPKPEKSGHATHVFGESSIFGQLTFSSLKPKEGNAFSQTLKKDSHEPFQGARTQLFDALGEDVEGQGDEKLHFEQIIPLPDKIQVITGEEGLEVLFSERAKLFRFDADSGQWKERGLGDIKLLRHPKSGQGRVVMRREHIKKLCANHNINAGMELKPNVGSDRSWVWYTPADYAEGEARPEKLAIKLKSAEIAGKFKDVFEDLQETLSSENRPETEPAKDQQEAGCTLYKQFLSTFAAAPDAWTCEVCYVENNAADSKCIACSSIKSAAGSVEPLSKTAEVKPTTTNASVVESVEPNAFQNFKKDSIPATSIFQSPKVKRFGSSQLFTIGRGESCDDKQDDEIYLSPSKTSSPSRQGTTPQKPSTLHSQECLLTNRPFGTSTPAKFTFSLQVSPKSPPRKPKSSSPPTSPLSPEIPSHAEPYFEPIIPLPDEIQVVTGEEGLEVLFSERAKLYRFDADSGQWKERGVGDVKLLRHPKSGQGRVLMRREHIKKLCANHNINVGMELKPNVGSDRSWVWYTPADYAEGEARPEKLAIKLKSAEIAGKFKEVFEDLQETLSSEIRSEMEPAKDQQGALYKQFMSTFAAAPAAWTCEVCCVENNAGDSKCISCSSIKSASGSVELLSTTTKVASTTTTAPVVESVEQNAFQDFNKDSSPATSVFQYFTIGRGESCDDKQDDEIYLSPSKMSSPSRQGTTPQKPSTPHSQESVLTDLPFGTSTPAKFTFSLQVSPKSPPPKPKSPLSPTLPLSPESPSHAQPYFKPIIPLPDAIQVVTGEEDLEVLFSERAKLYRFVADSAEWKERGVGDVRLLRHPKTGQGRVLMRREHIKKLCANHNINAGMELKPNVGSDRSWVWYTPADYAEDEARPEKLAIRFKSAEIAGKFKEIFDDVTNFLSSLPIEPLQSSQTQLSLSPSQGNLLTTSTNPVPIHSTKENAGAANLPTHCTGGRFLTPNSHLKGFTFGSATPSTALGFTFGSATPSTALGFTFGSATPSTALGFTFGSATPSTASGFTFGSAGTTEYDGQPLFAFGSFNQASNSISVSSPDGRWECDSCMVRNDSDKVECATCGSPKQSLEVRFQIYGSLVDSGRA
ncbi:hypothetical protein ACROYT_G026982 [Oculina patagonica]